jgi:hypothetical protein
MTSVRFLLLNLMAAFTARKPSGFCHFGNSEFAMIVAPSHLIEVEFVASRPHDLRRASANDVVDVLKAALEVLRSLAKGETRAVDTDDLESFAS